MAECLGECEAVRKNKEEIIDVIKRRREKIEKKKMGQRNVEQINRKKNQRKNGSMTQGNKFYENN